MPFEKGKSGNAATRFSATRQPARNGRPKELPGLRELLADVLGEEVNDLSAVRAILLKLRQMAISGNLRAAEILLERAYGRPAQPIEHTTGGGQSIRPPAIIVFHSES